MTHQREMSRAKERLVADAIADGWNCHRGVSAASMTKGARGVTVYDAGRSYRSDVDGSAAAGMTMADTRAYMGLP